MSNDKDWTSEGYDFTYDANGYSVSYKGTFLGGAGVKLPRAKKLHWRHAKANIAENRIQCINIAHKHEQFLKSVKEITNDKSYGGHK